MTPPRHPGPNRGAAALWVAAVGACAVCCAGPLLAVLAAVGLTAGVAASAVPALAAVTAAALGGIWWVRRRTGKQCAAPEAPAGAVALDNPVLRNSSDNGTPL